MIVYSLCCSAGHQFEGWFGDIAAYDAQAGAGTLECPVCGDSRVAKAIMAPAVKSSVTKAKGKPEADVTADHGKARQYFAGMRKFIEENAENVGKAFPEEARKIHYGEAEERHIYGESTLAQARDLVEEGIEVAPMPPNPDELN